MNFKLSFLVFCILIFSAVNPLPVAAKQRNEASPHPDRIILNLTPDASNSVAVTWRTDDTVTDGFCEIQKLTDTRINPQNTKSFKAVSSAVTYSYSNELAVNVMQHRHVFDNLLQGEKYLYRVGTPNYWSEWFEFKVPSIDNSNFSFVYFGDPQSDIKSQWSRVIRKAYNFVPDCAFMLYGGDIINRAGRDLEWQEWFEAGSYIYASVPQVFTPGNHDYDDLQLDPHWKYQFTQPANGPKEVKGTCFFTDYKNLKIISIDSATESELEDENGPAFTSQKHWLDSVLTVNDKEWVIVTTHLPFYSPKESRDNPLIRKHFQPVIEKHGVDLVLSGHDHSYARGRTSDNPEIKSPAVYVVSVSGPKLYEAGDKQWMQVKGNNLQLFQKITINGNELRFEAYSASGDLFDEFLLKKNRTGKSKFIELNKKALKK